MAELAAGMMAADELLCAIDLAVSPATLAELVRSVLAAVAEIDHQHLTHPSH